MLKFSQLSLRRGTRELLHDVSATIHTGHKVGITGRNGVGKSSLFLLLRNELSADAGSYSLPPATVIAHVAQETPAVDKPAIEYVMDGDTGLRGLQQQIQQAEQHDDGEQLAHLYADMEAIQGYSANSRAARLLHGLGFTVDEEQLPVRSFSGGWRMRLNLAQALMCRSDLLLLDEPTNHLDLEAVIWLEDWLRGYSGTLLLISHDRDFLDRVVTHIAHIERGEMTLYTGNYSDFEIRRAEQLAHQQAAYEKQQREIAHMQKFVDRFRAKATKSRQAQSRIKALERLTIISQAHVDSPFKFHFLNPGRIPDLLLKLDNISAGYDDTPILDNVTLNIAAGDRIGLLGHNGAGKSTLIKLLAGDLNMHNGERVAAKDINIGYFAQHQLEQLDAKASPLLHVQRLDPRATEQSLRNHLGGFAFNDEMATSPVAPLSGGEKARLVLAMIVYQKPSLLLLDEPTNHLDLEMRYALTSALQEFEGAMIIVSHDRHLLRTVTDQLYLVADQQVTPFDGDLEDYRQFVKDQERENDEIPSDKSPTPANKKQQRQHAAEKRRLLKPLGNKAKKLEASMNKLHAEQTTLQQLLSDSSLYEDANKARLAELLQQQGQINKELQKVEAEWLTVSEELESLRA